MLSLEGMFMPTYIFDLYGTLIDIWTDENDPAFWERLAAIYSVYGADYTARELQTSYLRLVREEEASLERETGYAYPEIELETVFIRLLREAPHRHNSAYAPGEGELAVWSHGIANTFRVLSRRRFGLFPHTLETLRALRERGCKIYLLSNAQKVFTLPEMEVCALPPLFDGLYFSSEHRMRKPQPAFMQKLLHEKGIDPASAVMVGNDFSSDMRIAASCGVAGVFLNTDRYSDAELREKEASLRAEFGDFALTVVPDGDIRALIR